MSGAQINRELPVPPRLLGGLDPKVFNPSPEEWEFLRTTVSNDEREIKERVLAAQTQ